MAFSGTLSSTDDTRHVVSERLLPSSHAPATARGLTLEALRAESLDDGLDTVLLVVSELVTNACMHARTEISFDVALAGDVVRVEVGDASSRQPVITEWDGRIGGLGLHLVDEIAYRWGTRRRRSGKVVWAECRARSEVRSRGR